MIAKHLQSYYIKIASFCAYQERCHKEVKEKLQKWDLTEAEIDDILIELIQEKYLNEQRFAASYARGKFRFKKWGRKKITHALQQKEVSSFAIKEALKEIDQNEYIETLEKILSTKYAEAKGKNEWEKKQKTFAYALSRGFESNLISDLIDNLELKKEE